MIQTVTFKSTKALIGFPMGDLAERTFPVYLPPDFEKNSSQKYPVVYLLAGFSGRGSTYLSNDTVYSKPLHLLFDRAISEKRMKPFIAVFPDCTSKLGHSQYVNSPSTGNYMDYLCDELVPFIDSTFPTLSSESYRAVHGHSSGGFGALVTGMMRPDRFKFIGSSAGDSFYEVSFLKNINFCLMEIEKSGSVEKFISDFLNAPTTTGMRPSQFEAMLMFAMAPLYAPNPDAPPLFGDLYFNPKTGEIIPEVWEKYLEWDPVRMVDRYIGNLKKLSYIQLEAGLQDEHGLQWGHRQIARKLKEHSVPVDVQEYPGAHGGHHWRYESRLIRLLEKMQLK